MYAVDDLIADFRSDVYDRADVDAAGTPRDTLWSPEDVLRYLNHAAYQWAHDTEYLRLNLTLTVTAGKNRYYVGREIIDIVEASYAPDANSRPQRLGYYNMDTGVLRDDYGIQYLAVSDLEFGTGRPRAISLDYDPTYLRLFSTPVEGGLLRLNLVVYPAPLQYGMPLPSSNPRDRAMLLAWMKYMAYQKQDADVQDLDRANSYRGEYAEMLVERKYELDRVRRDGGVIQSRW